MERNIIASRGICNIGGIAIYDIEYGINDRVLCGDIIGDHQSVPHWSNIRYNVKGDSFFMHHGRREYLSEYIRTNF